MDRNVLVLSGLIGAGKSWYLNELRKDPKFQDASVLGKDLIKVHHFGAKRELVDSEHVFVNELLRNELKTKLIVDGVNNILVELVMLTRKNHQEPFVETVRDAERYIQAIEREKALLARQSLPIPSRVNLRVVLLYCGDLSELRRRIEARRQGFGGSNGTDVASLQECIAVAERFEIPDDSKTYFPMVIDTSEDNDQARETALGEIRSFFLGRDPRSRTHGFDKFKLEQCIRKMEELPH